MLVLPCDVTDWDLQKAMFEHAVEHFGRIDAVFVNAVVMIGSGFLGGEDTPEEWRRMVLTNVLSAATTARLVLHELIKTKGHLLFTGSVLKRWLYLVPFTHRPNGRLQAWWNPFANKSQVMVCELH